MQSKALYKVGFIQLFFMITTFSCLQQKLEHMQSHSFEPMDGAAVYQQQFENFKYYIETIGTVTIDEVSLENEELTALYSYDQGSETRHVVSILHLSDDNIYKGTCTTKVDGKVLFSVNTWLTFNDDGTAIGNWSWSGAPSQNDPIVEISKH